MKYLRTKHSRRRGVAIELAMMLLLVMTAMSIMLVSTTMIQINKQKESTSDLTEIVDEIKKMEYDNVGKYFKQLLVQNINTTNENDIVTVDYITTKINEKYSTYFNERNLSFLVEVTDQGQTEEPFTNDDVITEQSVVQTEEEITYQNSDLEDVPSDSTSIEYVIHKVTETEFITYQLMKSSGKTEQITEGFNLKIFEKKDNELDQSNVLYEITISRILHKTTKTIQVEEYTKEVINVTTTTYLFNVVDGNNNNVIHSVSTDAPRITDSPTTIVDTYTTFSFIVTENDYSITNVEIK